MKQFKRKLAVLLAVCMVITYVLPVFAEPVSGLGTEDLYTGTEETELISADKESHEESENEKATPSEAEYTDSIESENDFEEIPEESGLFELENDLEGIMLAGAGPSEDKYTISINVDPADSASVILSKNEAAAGESVTFAIENNSDLSVSAVYTEPETELSESDEGLFSFEMPDSDVVINVELSNCITVGDFVISADEPLADDIDYAYSDGCLTIMTDRNVAVQNTDPSAPTTDHIYVPANVAAHLTLCGINIMTTAFDTPAVCISDDSNKTVHITLAVGAENLLYAAQDSAIRKRGNSGRLVIDGDGYLDARSDLDFCPVIGGRGTASAAADISGIEINSGHIYIGTIKERDVSALAYTGIGGGYNASASDICINGGDIAFEGFKNPVGGGYDPYGNYSGSENIVFSKKASIKGGPFTNSVPIAEVGSSEAVVLFSEFPLTEGMELSIDGTPIPGVPHDDGVTGTEETRYIYLTPASADNPHEIAAGGRIAIHIYYENGEWLPVESGFQNPIRFDTNEVIIALQDYSIVPYEGNRLINHNVGSAVQYSSSDRSIATVDAEGKVSPQKSGSIDIKAVSKKSGCPDVTASYRLTIKEKRSIETMASEHGNFTVDPSFAMEGEEINIISVPYDGYEFVGYALYDTDNNIIGEGTGSSFVMPDEEVKVVCNFVKPSVQIIVRQDASGRGLISAPASARPGETVYVSGVSEKGYELKAFDVIDQKGTLLYTNIYTGQFIMPDEVSGSKVYIEPNFQLKLYSISAENVSHGNVKVRNTSEDDITDAVMGETVELKVTPESDYELSSLSVKDSKGNNVSLTDKGGGLYEFIMPASNVSIKHAFARISHDIRIEIASLDGISGFGGKIEAFNRSSEKINSAVKGEEIVLRAYPETDYELSYLNALPDVTLSRIEDIMYSFEMPDEEVLIKAAFEKDIQEGTRKNPWKIGSKDNTSGIKAFIDGDYTLYIQIGEGIATMKDFDSNDNPAPYIYSIPSIKEIVVSEGVSNIGDYAFYNSSSLSHLTEVSLPDSLTRIGKYAFSGLSRLEKLTIPVSVNIIGANCFAGDTGLHTIIFEGKPDDFTMIDDNAFAGVTAEVHVPSSWLAADGTFDPSSYQFGGNLTYIVEGSSTEHVVNVRQPEHGVIEVQKNLYKTDDTVTVTLKNSNEDFGWYPDRFYITPYVQYSVKSIDGGKQVSFAMPDCDVEISALYTSPGYDTQPWLIGYEDAAEKKSRDSIYAWCDSDPADSSKKILYIKPQQENAVMVNFETGSRPWDIYADEISRIIVTEENGSYLYNIGERAFEELTALKEADLGIETKNVGKAAFSGCSDIEKVKMSGVNNVYDKAFEDCTSLVSVDGYKLFSIGQRAFFGCSSFLGNTLSNGKTILNLDYTSTLSKEAFSGCKSLVSVLTSSNVCNLEIIPEKAFYGCSSLTEVSLAKSVSQIEAEAFSNCSSLAKFHISGSCNNIASSAFLNDASRIYVTYDFLAARNDIDRQPHINDPGGKWYYGAKQLTYIVSTTPTNIYDCAVKINQTKNGVVKLFRQGSTKGSKNYIEIVSGGSLWKGEIIDIKVGGSSVPASDVQLNELTYIKDIPGYERTRLFEFNMPSNAGNQDVVFKISFEENASEDDFLGPEPDVPLPKRQGQPWDIAADGTSRIQAKIEDGTLYIKNNAPAGYPVAMMDFYGSSAPWYSVNDQITKVVIDDGITTIGNNAFLNCKNLESAVIPGTVAKIGAEAFYASGIKRLDIPEGVKDIGREAFYGCRNLSEINYEGLPTGIHSQAFRNSELTCYVTDEWLSNGVTIDDLNDRSGDYQYGGTIEYICASGAKHNITLNQAEGGTITLPFDNAAKGTLVVFNITPDYGYRYEKMISTGVSVTYDAQSFVMPANDVTLTPVFSKNHYYIYSDGGEGIYLSTEKSAYDVGDTVKIIPEPDPGYVLTKYGVFENSGDRSVAVSSDGTFTVTVQRLARCSKNKGYSDCLCNIHKLYCIPLI